jgi:membrane protein implicated in regulation of membrane protease activity
MTIKLLYFACFAIGFLYAFISSVLSHLFGGDGDHGGDIGHGDIGHADVSLPILSPSIIAAFITGFGGTGILVTYLTGWPVVSGVLAAVVGGLLLAGSAFGLLSFIYSRTQGGSEYQTSELVGASAEVISTIPQNGFGEIAYEARGSRVNAAARTMDGQAIAKHEHVKIIKIIGSTHFVKPYEE